MSLDYRFAPIDVDIITHVRVMEIDKRWRLAAFGLWTWGQCYAKLHVPSGMLSRSAVLSSLAAPEKEIGHLVAELVRVGLWLEADGGGYQIFNWDKKGPGDRKTSTARVRRHRDLKRDMKRDETRFSETSASISISPSVSEISLISRSEDPPLSPREDIPAWFEAAAETAKMAVDKLEPLVSYWLKYQGSRSRRNEAMSQQDAAGWLVTVRQSELEKARNAAEGVGPRSARQPRQPLGDTANLPWLKDGAL